MINVKPFIWGGVLFIVLGGFALAFQGFNYTHREKVLDVGPIHATAGKNEHVYISPLLGELALVGGIVLLTVGMRHHLKGAQIVRVGRLPGSLQAPASVGDLMATADQDMYKHKSLRP